MITSANRRLAYIMDEIDVVEGQCGIRPAAFMGPGEWVGDGSRLPYTPGHNADLPGCYSFCAVADDGSIRHLYIGKATNLRSRMVGHKNSGMMRECCEWATDHDAWPMVAFWLSVDIGALEKALCATLAPVLNVNRVL